jgi:polysaccharide biosynthesis protein PslJ
MLLAESPLPLEQSLTPSARRRWFAPGWPLWAALVLYPLWWALGLGAFAFIIAAVPMTWTLLQRRPIRLPPGFSVWVLFLIWNVLSLVMLPAHAPDTTAGSLTGRGLSLVLRAIQLATATVFLLYLVNLSPEELPQRRILRWMGGLFLVTVGGGLLALASPHFEFTSPFEHLLPHGIVKNQYVTSLVHPAAAQVQDVLGFQAPRPAAPWGYTNLWGNNLSILLVWFCVYMWEPASVRNRSRLAAVLLIAVVPIVYSLNRGLWFGIILSLGFIVLRLARRGDARATMLATGAIAVGAVLFLATPLNQVVQQRASHGASNGIRANVDKASLKGAVESPLIGWGDGRKVIGSSQSIAIGPSPKCPACGGVNVGSTGEIWLVMFNQGLLGALFYVGFFAVVWWRLRSDTTLIGAGARLIVILTVFYTFFYNNLPTGLMLSMLSIGIASRNLQVWPVKDSPAELA